MPELPPRRSGRNTGKTTTYNEYSDDDDHLIDLDGEEKANGQQSRKCIAGDEDIFLPDDGDEGMSDSDAESDQIKDVGKTVCKKAHICTSTF